MTTDLDRQIEDKRLRLQRLAGSGPSESSTRGINHLAVFALDLEASADFYINVMGMPVVSVTTNRDEPRSTHMNVDIGNGVRLSFFDFPHVLRLQEPAPEGAGGMMHVAIPVPKERFAQIEERLKEREVSYSRIGDSIYFKDPSGMPMELMIV